VVGAAQRRSAAGSGECDGPSNLCHRAVEPLRQGHIRSGRSLERLQAVEGGVWRDDRKHEAIFCARNSRSRENQERGLAISSDVMRNDKLNLLIPNNWRRSSHPSRPRHHPVEPGTSAEIPLSGWYTTMTPSSRPESARVVSLRPVLGRDWMRCFLAQRSEALDDFALRIGECEDQRDPRMPAVRAT
jgi:hypothetical protein